MHPTFRFVAIGTAAAVFCLLACVPFADAQVSIKKSIQAEVRTKEIGDYLAKLQDQIPVWTIYDPPESEQLANPPPAPDRFSR